MKLFVLKDGIEKFQATSTWSFCNETNANKEEQRAMKM
jgi:hypothetical protein